MKSKHILIAAGLLLFAGVALVSCEKDDSKVEYGFKKIYMPQALMQSGGVDNNYIVPEGTDSSTYNYFVEGDSLKVILGAYLTGDELTGYTVDIKVSTDTVADLISGEVLDTNAMGLPSTMYSIPSSLEVSSGQRAGNFYLSLNVDSLKKDEYVGKVLVLAVSIQNPSAFELNTAASTTIVVIDVDDLVIGPAVNVTNTYIKNPGSTFTALGMESGGRWGTLADWTANEAALSHNGYGGLCSDDDGITMDMESGWGSPQIYNGKIYQTITLPAGTYTFDPSPWVWEGTVEPAYVVVAPNMDSIPDYGDIDGNANIWYNILANPAIDFQLEEETNVTVGIVVNYITEGQGFKTAAVHLYNYPKHL